MNIPGVPGQGFKTVGQIEGSDTLLFRAGQDGLAIAVELLSTHATGAPVVDSQGKFIGFISEIDVLEAIEAGKNLKRRRAVGTTMQRPLALQTPTNSSTACKNYR